MYLVVLILFLCSVVLVAIVFALRLVSPPAIDRGSIIDGSRRTFLSAAGLLVPKFLFPLPVSRRSKLLQDFFPAVALPSAIKFEDIAQKAGVHFVVENCPTPEKHQPETMQIGRAHV